MCSKDNDQRQRQFLLVADCSSAVSGHCRHLAECRPLNELHGYIVSRRGRVTIHDLNSRHSDGKTSDGIVTVTITVKHEASKPKRALTPRF